MAGFLLIIAFDFYLDRVNYRHFFADMFFDGFQCLFGVFLSRLLEADVEMDQQFLAADIHCLHFCDLCYLG